MRTKKSLVIWVVCLSFILLLVIPYALRMLGVIWMPRNISLWKQLSLYQWVFAGCGIYFVLRKFFHRNLVWLETFTHELTHTVVAILTFRKVHAFQAGEHEGVVATSGRHGFTEVLMSLAPYCLPLYTYALLLLRPLIGYHGLWIFDILIGITLCFHIICFRKQTSPRQPDIHQYPLGFSYLYIFTAHVLNFCIIWVAFFPRYHMFSSFWRMVCAMWQQVLNWL